MGPLVPEVIGNELNFVVALLIGVAFGFVLEQAGFSTSKKLVGLFYGYDFTVLRVFFTAGMVAMFGVIALDHWGLLDMSLVYVNPTFLWSAIIGGLIMGLGFVIGGFCPGTSVCAAAIGKIDAIVFIIGSFFGVLAFAEGYPFIEQLYKSANWGNVRIYETLHISQSLFAFSLILVAVGSFWITTLIETQVNGKSDPQFSHPARNIGLTVLAFVIALTTFALPDRKESLLTSVANPSFIQSVPIDTMDSDELAFRLIDRDPLLTIIDLRPQTEYDTMSLPGSTRMDLENIFDKDAHKLLSVNHQTYLFVANDEITEKKGAALAVALGYTDVYYLNGGLNQFRSEILNGGIPEHPRTRHDIDTDRFRADARTIIPVLIREHKQHQVSGEPKKKKRVVGGC